jgi:hypothetical protein
MKLMLEDLIFGFCQHLKDKGWLDLEKIIIDVIDIESWFGNIQLVFRKIGK